MTDRFSDSAAYRDLFQAVDDGVCVLQMIFDEAGAPRDYLFLEVNPTFEEQTGLEDAVGRTARELVPNLDDSWFGIYGHVARTGEPARFENHAPAMDRWFDVFAVRVGRPTEHNVALFFRDITERKRRETNTGFLAEINADLATLSRADEILEAVRERTVRHLQLSSVAFVGVGGDDAATILHAWDEEASEASRKSCRLTDLFSEDVVPDLRAGRVVVQPATDHSVNTGGRLHAPHLGERRLKFVLTAARRDARTWRPDEIDLIRELSTNLWLRLDRARSEEALREADRRKDWFMALLSHELRNPLAPIKHCLQVLDEVPPESEQARHARTIMTRQVDQLVRLVGDLLDHSRVARGRIDLKRQRIDLADLVRQTVEDHRALFEKKGVGLDLVEDESPVYVEGDWNRLSQALGNLLQNAYKFTPAGKGVSVRLFVDEGAKRAILSVADRGAGMDAAILPTLFEPFAQADASLARSSGGLGLGLVLVKGIVELHGGLVTANSAGLGHGSQFDVTLPLDTAPREPVPPPTPSTAARKAGRRVLIIEDSADVAESLRAVLEIDGHEVEIAATGVEGLEKAHVFEPAIVFCDIGLPGMDGYEVARTMRDDPELRSVYRVALSGYAMPEDVAKAKAAGFERHFAKPLPIDDLRSLLTEVAREA